jgi:hypothetical protein
VKAILRGNYELAIVASLEENVLQLLQLRIWLWVLVTFFSPARVWGDGRIAIHRPG